MSKCFQSYTFNNNWQNQKTYKKQELFTIPHILVGHPIALSTSLFRDWMELGIIYICQKEGEKLLVVLPSQTQDVGEMLFWKREI